MSWTSYVEKFGSGTGEIIDKCRDHGLATPIYDPTESFFKTIIWRNGYGPMSKRDPVKGPSQGTQSEGPSQRAQSKGTVGGHSRRAQSGARVEGRVKGAESRDRVKALSQKCPEKAQKARHPVGIQSAPSRHPVGTQSEIGLICRFWSV